jgi:alkanesulfonate monooxygenase SsuD/methylene tetrahydromethanopterin reductase-like flavin-dependent oxidoreductase (luciferase family)
VVAADSNTEAQEQFQRIRRHRVTRFLARDRKFTDEEADLVLDSPQGRQIAGMLQYTAVGTPEVVKDYLDGFARHADADELIVAHQADEVASRLRSAQLLAEVAGLVSA